MFYAQFVLSKKGPLAKIWLAAHWEKKLTKAQVFETNIDKAVESILEPKVKMALRTTGHLLLGVVRIYSRKAKYLLADCNEAFVKIKMAFRSNTAADLQSIETHEASLNAITLPEVFHDFDSALPDFNDTDYDQQMSLNQSRLEEITMREELPMASFGLQEEAFGAEDFDPLEMQRLSTSAMRPGNFNESSSMRFADAEKTFVAPAMMDIDAPIMDDFGDNVENEDEEDNMENRPLFEQPAAPTFGVPNPPAAPLPSDVDAFLKSTNFENEQTTTASTVSKQQTLGTTTEVTTLIQNEEDSFVLGPVDATAATGMNEKRPKRKRRLLIDELKSITGEEMKAQLNDSGDTTTQMDVAPPSRKLMHYKETCVPERLLSPAAFSLVSKQLSNILTANAAVKIRNDDAITVELQLDQLLQHQPMSNGGADVPATPRADDHERMEAMLPQASPSLAAIAEELALEADDELTRRLPSVSPPLAPASPPQVMDEQLPTSPQRRSKGRASSAQKNVSAEMEEMSEDETADEQAYLDANPEEKQWSSRTQTLLRNVRSKLKTADYVNFVDLCARKDSRKMAAQKFYTLLVLKKWRAIDVQQEEPFEDIKITAGARMNEPLTV